MAGKLWRPLAPIGLAFRVQLWGHTEGVAASLGRALHPATAMAAVAPGANDLAAMALCQLLEQAPSAVPALQVPPLKGSLVVHALRSAVSGLGRAGNTCGVERDGLSAYGYPQFLEHGMASSVVRDCLWYRHFIHKACVSPCCYLSPGSVSGGILLLPQ